jgi:ABC-type ATPase with predicted acetyltransferase domain
MKYRQRGYRESEYEDEKKETRRREPKADDLGNREQVRSLRHAVDRNVTVVIRCNRCGYQVPASFLEVNKETTCTKCQTPLHSCRQCKHFDPAARWECREPIEARIADKGAANDCPRFKPAQVLDATGKRADTTQDARAAFHNLFKN